MKGGEGMRTFNYSAIKEQKWDSDVLGLIAAIYKEAGKQELYLSSTYEFLSNGRLIGYSGHELKFYELKYIKDGVWQVELTPEQVAELFPGLEIIRTSSAKDGIIEVERRPFGTKTVLLLNDTPASYYHYSFENFEHSGEPFKSVLRLNDARDIVFSHFGKADEANPILILRVKNKL